MPIAQLPNELHERYIDDVEAEGEVAKLRSQAESGNAQAMYLFALRHTSYAPPVLLIKLDKNEAFRWMKMSAERRHPRAMAVLGLYYLKGLGVEKNPQEASKWAKLAIDKGQPMGHRVLGEVMLGEAETIKPPKDAADERKLRAKYNDTLRKAYEHIRRGADQGDKGSLRLLGQGYENGAPDMPKNYRIALDFYAKAALKRDSESIRLLVDRYSVGDKVPLDRKLAYAWLMVLIEVDDKDEDRNQLANLSESMQAEDVMLAQELGAQQIKSLTSESADALSRLNATR